MESDRCEPKECIAGGDVDARRRKLLAMIHIAKEDLKWSDNQYRKLLETTFGVPTASALHIPQLEWLVEAFKTYGWKPKYRPGETDERVLALRSRIMGLAGQVTNGQARLKGLCRAICSVDDPRWCRDEAKLKRLLAALGNISRKDREKDKARK